MTTQSLCKNILIRGVNWIGDAVMTMPAIRCARDNWMESTISLLAKPWVSDLFAYDPNIDTHIEYRNEYNGIAGKIKASRDIKKFGFDCSLLLQNAFDAALIAFLSSIPERIGYRRDGRGFLLSKPIAANKNTLRLHHIEYYLNLLKEAGLETRYRLPWIYPQLRERLEARERILHLRRPIIGLNPGAAYGSAKRWYPERFGELANSIIKATKGSIVLFGSKKEHLINIDILNNIEKSFIQDKRVFNLSGKTTLRELCNIIAECDLLVSNDSGPMHICYSVGTPLVALFGSTSPDLTGPPDRALSNAEFGYNFRVIQKETPCSPCFERTCKHEHLECMNRISTEEVFQNVMDILPTKRAVFFDRDGTLCRDAHYLNGFDDFKIFPEIHDISSLKKKGFLLIGITNQSGIARGIVNEQFVQDVNSIFINKHGFDAFYYCPHHPDDRCACRKPMHGMLLKARADLYIDFKQSYLIGDKESDMITARIAGMKGIHITNTTNTSSENSDFVVRNITECISKII